MAAGTRRMALKEICVPSTGSNNNNHLSNIFVDLPLTPVSPEEEVIRLRGRHKASSQSHSRTIDEIQLTPKKTPSKSPRKLRTPQKLTPPKTPLMPSRSSPRKRLNLQDAMNSPIFPTFSGTPINSSPSKFKRMSPNSKRPKLSTPRKPTNMDGALSALSHSQLVDLVKNLMNSNAVVVKEVEDQLPSPDLSPLEDKLNFFQRNIYRSIPSTRWESNRDSFCYRRISTHLEAFKKECVDQGRKLIDSQQWDTALDYVLLAWRYVRSLPDWDNPAHNKSKTQCFKSLASVCLTAIKKGELDAQEHTDLLERLTALYEDSKYFGPCIDYLKKELQIQN